MGRPRAVQHSAGCRSDHFLVVPVKDYLVPFAVAFAVCCVVFLGLDFTIMKLQGLSLFYTP